MMFLPSLEAEVIKLDLGKWYIQQTSFVSFSRVSVNHCSLFTGIALMGIPILRGVVSVVSGDPAGAVSNLTESYLTAADVAWPEGAMGQRVGGRGH